MATGAKIPASIVRRCRDEFAQVRRDGKVETARKHGYPYTPPEWYGEDHFTYPFRSCLWKLKRIVDLGGQEDVSICSVAFSCMNDSECSETYAGSIEMFLFDWRHQPAIKFTFSALRELGMEPSLVCDAVITEDGTFLGDLLIRV